MLQGVDPLRAKNVVIGAGSMGIATAYQLARRGEPVLLIEQFAIGHDRGSSHGASRIIRHSYADEFYARLMPAAFAEWRDLEAIAGVPLYLRTGGVSLSPATVDYVANVAAALKAIDIPYRRMTGQELNAAIPVFAVSDDYDVVFEPDAGMILADRALRVMLELARSLGGDQTVIRQNCRVERLDLDSERPTILLEGETIEAERLIVTAGPWVASLVPELAGRLQTERQQILYFLPEDTERYSIGHMPVFISVGAGRGDFYYGMPGVFGGGIKAARHGGETIEADSNDRKIGDEYRSEIREFMRGCIPSLADSPITNTEICKYTVAPNEDFLVGVHPGHSRVFVASPCSGHGFKFSPLIGRLLADLATSSFSDLNVARWDLSSAHGSIKFASQFSTSCP